MAFFNRKNSVAATAELPETGVQCQDRSCESRNAVGCAYRDRRGHHCKASFCEDHSVRVDNVVYCRRHAGTMRALGSRGAHRAGLPDIENRGPSLVNFMAAALDAQVTELLKSVARQGEHVLGDDEVTMAFDPDRRGRWERSWRVVESTGVVMKITVYVDDDRDSMVTVRVGSEMVAEGVPPWIQHRGRKAASASADEEERENFYKFLMEHVTAAVRSLRVRDDHPSWV